MNRRVTHEVNFLDEEITVPRVGLRNKIFKPWFEGKENWGVEIIDGFYTGLVIQIKEMQFVELEDGNLSLDYHVVHKPETVAESDLQTGEFQMLLSDIIEDILKEAIATNEARINHP